MFSESLRIGSVKRYGSVERGRSGRVMEVEEGWKWKRSIEGRVSEGKLR